MINRQDYASLVRNARKRTGLNTTNFGALIGVSGRTIEDWEQGRRNPGNSSLLLIKKLLREFEIC